jgi:SAM-dependent methyltransferase
MVASAGDGVSSVARALSFGSVAEQYERYRPGYSEDLVDVVFQYAARPVCSAVEVGAGTGKATRLFAGRGVEVTALEPDAAMADVLRQTTAGLPVVPVETTFENYRSARRVDLVFAAAAWHWTDPTTRMARAVDLLSPGGVLALFGSSVEPADPDLCAAVEQIESEVLPDDSNSGEMHPWSLQDLMATERLTECTQLDLPRVVTRSAEESVGRLATVSAYLMLSPAARAEALCRIQSVLPVQVEVDATIALSLARRI